MVALSIFVVCLAFLFYTILGYPAILSILARRKRGTILRFEPLSVSVVLPVYNGEKWIRDKLDCLLALDYPQDRIEIFVISDGSEDRTDAIAAAYRNRGNVRLIRIPKQGKAAALQAGIQQATGEILFFTDVRQRLDPASLRLLVAHFADPLVGAVSGELVILPGERQESADIGMYWRYEKWIRKQMSRIDSFPGATGSIYVLRRCLAKPMPPDVLLDDVYLPVGAFLQGYRIIFEERAVAYDYPTLLKAEFQRKMRTLAGAIQIMRYYPALLGPRNRMWFHFMSHKFARLLLPYALLGALTSAWWLPQPWAATAVSGELLLSGLAAADKFISKGVLKQLSSAARTFLVLMAATLCAAAALFFAPGRLWTETKVVAAAKAAAAHQ